MHLKIEVQLPLESDP